MNPGKGLGGPGPLLFLDQNEAQRAEKIFLKTGNSPHPPYLKVWIRHCAVVHQFCAKVITSCLYPDAKCFCTVLEKIPKISSGKTNHNNFLVIFEGIAKFSSLNPSSSLPSFATDNRIHFQCLNILLSNKTGP